MNRRSFLKFCGIAPVVPMVAVEALGQSSPLIESAITKSETGVYSVHIKPAGQDKWETRRWSDDQSDPIADITNFIGTAMERG